MKVVKTLCMLALAAVALAGCEGDGDRAAAPTGPGPIQVNCKSPITGLPVPTQVALRQAQTVANVNNVDVKVDCGDPAPVVVVPQAS